MNKHGVSLVELLVVLAIMGILATISMPMYTMGYKMIHKLTEATLDAQEAYSNLQSMENMDMLDWKKVNEDGEGQPLLCFQNGLVFICEENKPCVFENGFWKRGNKQCSEGILLRNQ